MSNITLCPFEVTDTHICYPTINSTWYEGTNNMVKWFIFDPIYRNNYSSLSLYFYYKNNYQYHQTVKFTNIAIDKGFYPFFIDKNFFPINCTENEIKWDYSLLLVGNKINPNIVLNSTFSDWIPTNFILIQNSSQSCSNNSYGMNNTIINPFNNEKNNEIHNNNLDKWKIIIIVVLILIFLIISIIILFLIRKKIYKKISKKDNICEILFLENEKKDNIKIIKPDENIIKYEKPNSY